jgi:hypothetical protein
MLGVAPLPSGDSDGFIGTHQAIELSGEAGPVELLGVDFFHSLDRPALNKETLDRIEWGKLVVTRLQRPHFVRDAEQVSDEILEMGRQIDEKVRLGLALDRVRVASRCHQAVVQRDIGLDEMGDKGLVEAHETVAIVKTGD